jgi:ribose transport system permease protein
MARGALLLGLSLILLVVGQMLLPGFFGAAQLANQLQIAAFLGLFALCQTVVIAAGGQGLDLSVGALATLGGILSTALLPTLGVWPAGLVAVAAGLAVGALNGLGVAVLRVPPLVATLTTASVVDGGLIVGVSVFQPAIAASPDLVVLAGRATLGVPHVVLLWAAIALVAVWLLMWSAWGRRLCGTGANATVARLSGTDTTAMQIGAYTLSGGIAAATGVLLTGYVGQGFLGLGNAYVLTSIVAAAIGGVALEGGRASYVGVVCAAVMMTILVSLLTAVAIGESGRQIVFGLTLLSFVAFDRWSRR